MIVERNGWAIDLAPIREEWRALRAEYDRLFDSPSMEGIDEVAARMGDIVIKVEGIIGSVEAHAYLNEGDPRMAG